MPSVLHMMSTSRRPFSTKMNTLATAKFVLPLESRFTPVQVIPDRMNPKF